ncbi:MAG: FtsW/RodA/SpoVE family cell cycle protein [Coriobacteriaceae bacterium]|jgi:peptidoglycan glycosyltransferase|nr:FtsW/RodA/SpoVE family cell cycle protein [Coriobacteriaceae bacterium]
MNRRNIELTLLCIAAPIVILIFAMMAINLGQELNATTLGVPLGIFASFILAHFAARKFSPGADPALLPIAFVLSGIGIAFVTRLKPALALHQVMWLFLGVICMVLVIALIRNLDKVANYKYTLMIAGIVLLLSPLLPFIGQEFYGSRIWLSLGNFSFQPGEIAKIVIVLFLAGYLAANREMLSIFTAKVGPFRFPDLRTLLPLLVMWGISLVIVVFEKDLGSALVFFFIFLAILYVATGKKFYLVVGLGLAILGAMAAWMIFSHVQVRVDIWLDPFDDAAGKGYQIVQSLFSMADGGLFGVGIGRGLAESIPVVESDFIFVAIAEEAGLLGGAGILLLYLCLTIRGFTTAARAKSDVSSFIAVGLIATIVLQAFIIVGGITRLIPLTGLTLPFISQGGSSLLASFISIGFLMKCGDEATGVGEELKTSNLSFNPDSVLGRIALGKRLTNNMIIFSVLFALLVGNLTWIMIIKAEGEDGYRNMEGNNHTLAREAKTERGTITTYDGVTLAHSIRQDDGYYLRVYPSGNLASHVVGYYSTQYGKSGIEAKYNDTLRGQQNFARWIDALNSAAGINQPGNDVRLTINSTIQQAAQDALAGSVGACVVIDPKTGAVLALASSPTYDASEAISILESGNTESSELFNRATQPLYAPGSTFKMLTLATALENNIAVEDDIYSSPGEMDIGNAPVINYDKTSLGDITLARATELSSNTVFGQVGVEIGSELLVSSSERFGFNKQLAFDLPLTMSLMPVAAEMTIWETAWSAVGQPVGEHSSPAGPQATVLQMALVGCAIANGGTIQAPYLVDSISNAQGVRSFQTTPTRFGQAMSASTADRTKTVLEGVVNQGTGTPAAIGGIQVAGKTGTAETGKEHDDSWFVGFAPSNNPSVVVAIIIEEGTANYQDASAKAQNVLRTALEVQGLL